MEIVTKNYSTKQALILVGGFGTRLKELFPHTPKPLVPIAGRPFLDLLLQSLKKQLISDVILLTHYKSEDFSLYPSRSLEFGLNIQISHENLPLGSAGAILNASKYYPLHSSFLLVNGDTFFEGSLTSLLQNRSEKNILAQIGVCEVFDSYRYGTVLFDTNLSILSFKEKSQQGCGWVNSGLCILSNSILAYIKTNCFQTLENDVFPKLTSHQIKAHKLDGEFIDIGLPKSYSNFNFKKIIQGLAKSGDKNLIKLLSAFVGLPEIVFVSESGQCSLKSSFLQSNFSTYFESYDKLLRTRKLTAEDLVICINPKESDLIKTTKNCVAQIFVSTNEIFSKFDTSLHDGQFVTHELEAQLKKVEQLWSQVIPTLSYLPNFEKDLRSALFLDRDGVVIEHIPYIKSIDCVKLKSGIENLINEAHKKNWLVILVTNQSGIGRGYFSWREFDAIQNCMMQLLANKGAWIDRVLVSGYHDSSQRYEDLMYPHYRKPRSSMILSLIYELRIDCSKSYFVGDRTLDLRTGYNAGVKNLFLIQSKEGKFEEEYLKTSDHKIIEFMTVSELSEINLIDY